MKFRSLIAGLALLACSALAQDNEAGSPQPEDPLAAYPNCARACIELAFTDTPFCPDPGDQKCTCTNEGFIGYIEGCVMQTCTLRDALTSQNITTTTCQTPTTDKSGDLTEEVIAMLVTCVIVVAARSVFNAFLSDKGLWWDDYSLILLLLLGGIPSMVIQLATLLEAGVGRDIWVLPFDDIDSIFFYNYIETTMYFLQVALLKLTFLLFFMRIFPAKGVRRIIQVTMLVCAAYGIAFSLVAIFSCWPIRFNWVWDGSPGGSCIDRNAVQWGSAIISIILDVWIIAIPLWNIRKLKMHWKKKLGVASMFLVGILVTIISCIRLKYLNDFFNSNNPTLMLFDILRWSTIECYVSVICACMPSMRQMVLRLFPKVFGSGTKTSASSYYPYDASSSNERREATDNNGGDPSGASASRDKFSFRGTHSTSMPAVDDDDSLPIMQNQSIQSPPSNGIIRATTYAVRYETVGPDGHATQDVQMDTLR